VAQLEEQLAKPNADVFTSAHKLNLQLALAWQMRQRDTDRALALVDEVELGLAKAGLLPSEQCGLAARIGLIRGEVKWLSAELTEAKQYADAALTDFEQLGDPVGQADAFWLLGILPGTLAIRHNLMIICK